MRTDAIGRVILNAAIFSDMLSEQQQEKNIRFACINTALTEIDSELKIRTYTLKFQNKQACDDFFKAFQSAKESAGSLKKSEKISEQKEQQDEKPKEDN